MTDINVGIRLRADNKGLVGTVRLTAKEINALERELRQLNGQATRSSAGMTALDAATGRVGSRMQRGIGFVGGFKASIVGLIAALGIAQFIRLSDEMTNLNNQLKLVTSSSEELYLIQSNLLSLSNQTRSSYTATAELYAKLHRSTQELNVSNEQLLAVTKAINQSFAISGASTAEAEGSTRQLAQALASGAFRGDEFNSVAEQAPRLMQALAAETGKTTGELRALAAEGKLTSEILIAALVNQSSIINEEFGSMQSTIGQATTVLTNNISALVGTFNDATGASSGVADGILAIGNHLGDVNALFASGELEGYFDALAENWGVNTDAIGEGLNILSDAFSTFFDFIAEYYQWLGRQVLTLPQNVRYAAKRLIEEFKYIVEIGQSYGKYFAQVVEAELAELSGRVGVIAREIADQLAFWDGDTYNATEAMAAASQIAEGMTAEYLAAKDQQVAAANSARDAAIIAIGQERNAAIASFDAQIAKARALRDVYQSAANDPVNSNVVPIKGTATVDGPEEVSDSDVERLRESLLTKEEAILAHYQRQQNMINEALVQQKISEDEHRRLSLAAHNKYHDDKAAYAAAKNNLILSSSQQIFGALAGLAEQFGGKQSKAFKVMFAIQKGFAIAQGILNLATAISNASAIPFPANIPAMAAAAAQGASLVANIKGATYKGQAHDGVRRMAAANEGTYFVRRDEMVLNPRQRENFEEVAAAVTKPGTAYGTAAVINLRPTIQIDATNAVPGMEAMIQERVQQGLFEYHEMLERDFSSNGKLSQTLMGSAA
ncbi:tape measure protein [Glaciecola sp. 1036]|uniref:tape measure protein n=1 Tax=Alteromonadaceae TaxID=72275 RepID=UPI003D06B112